MKKCSKCKWYKKLSDFHRDNKNPDKKHYLCKECVSNGHKEWMKRKKDGVIEAY